jgi:molecular chaperone GrpE
MENSPTPQEETTNEFLEKEHNELTECKDKYLRLLAESENMRKRVQKEKQESIRFALDNAFADILTPIDNFENALSIATHSEQISSDVKNWALGFQMILGQFKDMLSQNGIHEFLSEGKPFDPHRHLAIETEETDAVAEGIVLKEFVKGYASHERTIRPARVKVSKRKEDPQQEQQETEAKENN